MGHYLLSGAWAVWEEVGCPSLLRLGNFGKWKGLYIVLMYHIVWGCFAVCCNELTCSSSPGITLWLPGLVLTCRYALFTCTHVFFCILQGGFIGLGTFGQQFWKAWDLTESKEKLVQQTGSFIVRWTLKGASTIWKVSQRSAIVQPRLQFNWINALDSLNSF